MPIYVYQVIQDDGSEGETFEILQSMSDPALTHHPETGKKVRRCVSAPTIGGKYPDYGSAKKLMSDRNLEAKGFTKYVKSGDGTYEKTAGKGPKKISRKKV